MTDKGGTPPVAAEPMTVQQFESLYASEYPKLVKLLAIFDATIPEAEDAAQKALIDLARRSMGTKDMIASPEPYARRAAVNYFIKDRQRERDRPHREIRGGHVALEAYADVALTAWEDEQYIEGLLECLTATQREVIRRVLDGMSTREIAEDLGKREENIRQQLKNGRDRLREHPDIAPLAPRRPPDRVPRRAQSLATASDEQREGVE